MGGSQQHTTREELQAVTDAAKPRPKANPAAEKVEDIYPLSTLIDEQTLDLLPIHHWQENIAKKLPVTIVGSRYVSQRLQKVVKGGDTMKIKALRYVLLLLDVLGTLKVAGGRKIAKGGGAGKRLPEREELRKATGVQDFVIEGVRKRFFDGSYVYRFSLPPPSSSCSFILRLS